MIADNEGAIGAARTADDARRLDRDGKLIAFKSMENSYPLGLDLSLLQEFYERGVRLAGPVHGLNNQFADSETDKPRWNAISPLGRQWVARMNRIGIVLDVRHSPIATYDQPSALSHLPNQTS